MTLRKTRLQGSQVLTLQMIQRCSHSNREPARSLAHSVTIWQPMNMTQKILFFYAFKAFIENNKKKCKSDLGSFISLLDYFLTLFLHDSQCSVAAWFSWRLLRCSSWSRRGGRVAEPCNRRGCGWAVVVVMATQKSAFTTRWSETSLAETKPLFKG